MLYEVITAELPFHTGGEPAAAAPSQAAGFENVDDLLRRFFCQALAERFVTVERDIFINTLRIDDTAVS